MTMNCDVLIALALNDEERDFAKRHYQCDVY